MTNEYLAQELVDQQSAPEPQPLPAPSPPVHVNHSQGGKKGPNLYPLPAHGTVIMGHGRERLLSDIEPDGHYVRVGMTWYLWKVQLERDNHPFTVEMAISVQWQQSLKAHTSSHFIVKDKTGAVVLKVPWWEVFQRTWDSSVSWQYGCASAGFAYSRTIDL